MTWSNTTKPRKSKENGTSGDVSGYRPIRGELREWFKDLDLKSAFGFTSSMKQAVRSKNDRGRTYHSMDATSGSRQLRYCLNRINTKVHGKKFRKHGKFVSIIPVFERRPRWHFHALMWIPDGWKFGDYSEFALECWGKTEFAHKEYKIVRNVDAGWMGYITKFRNTNDDIDFANLEIPKREARPNLGTS